MELNYTEWCKWFRNRGMLHTDLCGMTGVFVATFAKMVKGECIALPIIARHCTYLKCDVMEVVTDNQ